MTTPGQQISLYTAALASLEGVDRAGLSAAVLQTLVARDKVALALQDKTEVATPAELESLRDADARLAKVAEKFDASVWRDTLEAHRRSVNPDKSAWWWTLEDLAKKSWSVRLSTLLAIILVTGAFGLIADTFNLLRGIGANPISTIGALIQAALAFVAASAFTASGRQWLVEKFSRFGNRTFKGWARTWLALLVFGGTLAIRFAVPAGGAWYFHWVGDGYQREGLYEQAATAYKQASSLKPYTISHRAALAKAQERSTDYAQAIAEYKTMTALYERPGTGIDDNYFFAKCELIKLLISHEKNYTLAEKTIKDLQLKIDKVSEPNRRQVQYFLRAYHGWIELKRKNLATAKGELEFLITNFQDGPVARYLLAQVLIELKQEAAAKVQFSEFLRLLQQPHYEEIPLEWISNAQEGR